MSTILSTSATKDPRPSHAIEKCTETLEHQEVGAALDKSVSSTAPALPSDVSNISDKSTSHLQPYNPSPNELHQMYKALRQIYYRSGYPTRLRKAMREWHESHERSRGASITRAICAGVGSFGRNRADGERNMYQFIYFEHIMIELTGLYGKIECFLQEPCIEARDEAFLNRWPLTITQMPEAGALVTDHTFLFSAHLDFDRLVEEFISGKDHSPALMIANSFLAIARGLENELARIGEDDPPEHWERFGWTKDGFRRAVDDARVWMSGRVEVPINPLGEEERADGMLDGLYSSGFAIHGLRLSE